MALLGWKMIFGAVEKAGSLDPEKIIETFENNFQWKSPVGLWTMPGVRRGGVKEARGYRTKTGIYSLIEGVRSGFP
jgi:hypothetical protein